MDRARAAMSAPACSHIEAVVTVKHPAERVCQECVAIGARWVHGERWLYCYPDDAFAE